MKQREGPHNNEPHRIAIASAMRMSITKLLLEHVCRTASRLSRSRSLGSVT
jgi:hypothetical protein